MCACSGIDALFNVCVIGHLVQVRYGFSERRLQCDAMIIGVDLCVCVSVYGY